MRPSDFGSRYSQLLELLWKRTDLSPMNESQNTNTSVPDARARTTPLVMNEDEFSWLDLQAVGEFLSGDQVPPDLEFGMDDVQQYMLASRRGSISWNYMGWPPDNDMNRFF